MRYQPAEPDPPWDGPEPEEPTDAELLGLWPDPFAGPSDPADAWPADTDPEVVAKSWAAKHPADLGQADFESGGPLDVLPPDPVLAFAAAGVHDGGLGRLSDDELIGLLGATRRLSSWQAAMELDAVAELDRRRAAQAGGGSGSSRAGEQVSAELALALTLTGRSADALLCPARDLGRMPAVRAALSRGQIDRAKSLLIKVFMPPAVLAPAGRTGCAVRPSAAGLARRFRSG